MAARLRDEFESGLDKVVVFAWHTDVIDALHEALSEFYPCIITGETPQSMRQVHVDAFQNPNNTLNKVFIGNITVQFVLINICLN